MRNIIYIFLFAAANLCAAPLTLDVPTINLSDAIRLLAGYAGKTVVISSEVHGSVGLRTQHEEPEYLLNTLLETHQLVKTQRGNVWYISPRSAVIIADQQTAEWRAQSESAAVLQSQVWKIRYARASEIMTVMQDEQANLLSERGHLAVDARTNQIFARDTGERLKVIDRLVRRLDVPVQQVLVEARLVSMDQDAERQLGIDFTVRQPDSDESSSRMLNVPQQRKGKYSIAIASLPDGSMLDVKLAALEQQGKAELISSPSLFAGSQQEASIEAGEEVPYQEVSESGGTAVSFKKAVLGLHVTPQILPGQRVLLSLKINQDRPAARMVQGVPAISTRQIVTNVQLKSGATIVLGGIYETNHEESQEGLPVLGKIPLIGLLFSQQSKRDQKRELLIFVTPTIMPQAL